MLLRFRPIQAWPPSFNREALDRRSSPFTATYRDTLSLLDRELSHLGAQEATIQVDTAERNCRADGGMRHDAKVNHPGVILSFESRKFGTLSYPCDAFGPGERWTRSLSGGMGERVRMPAWQNNLRAIALGLEALRKVERYGIAERGQQYAGWAALPPGIAMGRAMTADEAARLLAKYLDGADGGDLLWDEGTAEHDLVARAYRAAAKVLHPDAGGDQEEFDRATRARDLLKAMPGR